MKRALTVTLVTAIAGVLVAAGYGDATVYDGPATRAAALRDRHVHVGAPTKAQSNSGEVAIYRTHANAVKALAQAEALARLFGQSLKRLAAVEGNAIVGFDKRPTTQERAEAVGWLRTG